MSLNNLNNLNNLYNQSKSRRTNLDLTNLNLSPEISAKINTLIGQIYMWKDRMGHNVMK